MTQRRKGVRMRRRRSRTKGLSPFSVVYLMMMLGLNSWVVHDLLVYYQKNREETIWRNRQMLHEATDALALYMLLRPERPFALARGAVGSVRPRTLMLPCPDNIGDGNLDGSQDVSCGAAGPGGDAVNGILKGGSRFGRLPWRTKNLLRKGQGIEHSLNDGLDINVRDIHGNRPWYAVARNLAPAPDASPMTADARLPMNLHRLLTREAGWLKVVRHDGYTVSRKAAAVVIAPGKELRVRAAESKLSAATALSYISDVQAKSGMLAPHRYFEAYTIRIGGAAAQTVTNYNRDGIFAQVPPLLPLPSSVQYNDEVLYLDMEELVNVRRSWFVRVHGAHAGTTSLHNSPMADRVLSDVTVALAAYRDMFGFYPAPARLDNPAHLNQRDRHCAIYDTAAAAVATLAAGTPLQPAAAITVRVSAGGGAQGTLRTVQLLGSAAFLLPAGATAAARSSAKVRYADEVRHVATLSLGRYARLTLADAPLLAATDALPPLTAGGQFTLTAAAQVQLPAAQRARVAARAPLAPAGNLLGWLGEHALPPRRAGNNGNVFTLHSDTRAMFYRAATLTMAGRQVILRSGDILMLTAGAPLRLQQDFARLRGMNAVAHHRDGSRSTLANAKPTQAAFNRRQLAVWLLADVVRGKVTVTAPAVLHPWRAKLRSHGANSRDNLHSYPPCFDTREFFGRQFREKIKDQPLVYAVAAECHYGGDAAACGRQGGLTVSVASGATVALPQPFTLTHSYTVTVGNFLTVAFRDGVPQPGAVTMPKALPLPLLGAGGATLAVFKLTAAQVFAAGRRAVLPAKTPLIGGSGARIENVPALLIYSPAPLQRTACASSGPLQAMFDQQRDAHDITDLCYWVDDSENADGDGLYVLHGAAEYASQRNDYFILLGGQARI